MDEPLYSVIVNWNLKDDTFDCVNSFVKAGSSLDKIIVVDNASTDGSIDALRHQFGPLLNILVNDKNLGYAGGLNTGINFVLQHHAEWILLINNDVIVDSTFYFELIKGIRENQEFKIISPLIFEYNRPTRIWFLGDKVIPLTLLTRSLSRGEIDQGNLVDVIPVDFVSGCAMMVHRSVFESIGLFSTRFFMYAEEVDFLQRARLAGFRSATVTRAKMWHKISASAGRDLPGTRYLKIYNQILFYKHYSSFWQLPLIFGFTLFRSIVIAFKDLIKQRPELIAPLIKGWFNGWFNSNAQT